MKILFIASDNSLSSGAFNSMVELCRLLKNKGYEPLVIVPRCGDGDKLLSKYSISWKKIRTLNWTVSNKGFKHYTDTLIFLFKFVFNIISITRIAKVIRKERIDLVHINTIWTYAGAVSAIACRVPFVWHIREGLDVDQNRQLVNDNCYSLIKKADRIIFVSNYLKKHYESKLKGKKCTVIYNGINETRFLSERLNECDKNTIEFLSVGGMTFNKGQDVIIEAVKLLRDEGIENFHVSFVGTGKKQKEFKQYVLDNRIDQFITFCGKKENVSEYYKKADAFIMSSDAEAFGRVTVEAMLSGCLVLGSESGGTPELLDQGEVGILFEKGNANSLADKMKDVILCPDKYYDLSRAGQMYAINHFTSERNADAIIDVYNSVLRSKHL